MYLCEQASRSIRTRNSAASLAHGMHRRAGTTSGVRGLDIGCGANCVYSLLGAAALGWHMTALDTDAAAISHAATVLAKNDGLQTHVQLVHAGCADSSSPQQRLGAAECIDTQRTDDRRAWTTAERCTTDDCDQNTGCLKAVDMQLAAPSVTEPRLVASSPQGDAAIGEQDAGSSATQAGLDVRSELADKACAHMPASDVTGAQEAESSIIAREVVRRRGPFDFCVCNPPFFADLGDAFQNPDTAFGGTAAEMACPGGEAQFVGRLITESLQFPGLCHWFSTMLGKKATFKALRLQLKETHGVTAVRSCELVQGRTHRWVLAWSFVVDKALAQQPLRAGVRCGHWGESSESRGKRAAASHGRAAEKMRRK